MVNLMKFKTLTTVALLCLSQFAFGLGPVVSQAYEISLSNFQAPATANGGVTFQECETCDRQTVRTTEDTRYSVNGESVRLADFRRAISQVSARDDVSLTVLHHLESDTIVMIDVYL